MAEPPSPERRGMLGWLRRAADATAPAEPDPDAAPVVQAIVPQADAAVAGAPAAEDLTDAIEIAAIDPVDAEEPRPRRGLFGLGGGARTEAGARSKPRTGPDARDVAPGTVLPFGEVARVCDARRGDMGEVAARAARKGRGYTLYDSAPGSASPRTFFMTGFADNCPRQFTAAIALFGAPELHEQLRYGLPARDLPYSETDEAYEKLKAQICNVGRSKPCGPRVSRMENTTTFVSAYENFGENARWADMLIHDGEVLAAALKTP